MQIPPIMVKMVLDKLDEGYDAEQIRAGVAALVQEYPEKVATIRTLLADILAELPEPAVL